ncbi:MAG: O-antigen ligase family protein [Patescibacteria group bacterium]
MALEKTLRWIVLSGVFALPFIVFFVASSLFFPFITGKNFAFRIIVEVITGAYLALALANPAYRPRRNWLLAAFAIFLIVIAVADAMGAYPFKSFWSNYERMDGWVTQAHLFAYFLVAVSVLNTAKLWRSLWQVSLVVSAFVGLYGLLQMFGIASVNAGFSSASRIDATFGNPIYLAAYMLFNVFIAALLWRRAWKDAPIGHRTLPAVLYGGVIVLDTVVLFLTGTRGAMLGIMGGGLLCALLLAVFARPAAGGARESPHARKISVSVIVGFLVLAGGFYLVKDQAWIQKVGFLSRLATISLSDSTTKARLLNAGMAFEGFKERPLLGWGQENYAIVFDKYYDPRMYAQEQWFDRVHNTVLDWLVAGGALGLLSYLALFACALWCIWRPSVERGSTEASTPNVKRDIFDVFERSILTGLLAAYFFHNLFVFDNITSYILFVSVLAYIAWRVNAARTPAPLFASVRTARGALPVVAACAALAVWGAGWWVNAKPLEANRTLLKAIAAQQGGITKNLEYFKAAIALGSYGTQEAREQLSQGAAQLVRAEGIPDDVKKNFAETAAKEMSLQAIDSPLDARFPLFLGVLLDAYGAYAEAATALSHALELSPKKQTILYAIGSNAFARGDTAAMLDAFKRAYELAPENNDARIYYAAALIRVEGADAADELLAPLMESGAAADTRVAAAYVSRGRYDKVALIWEARVKAQPQDVQAYFTLAAAYFGAKNPARAVSVLQTVGSLIPGSKEQADQFIKEIRDGTAKI